MMPPTPLSPGPSLGTPSPLAATHLRHLLGRADEGPHGGLTPPAPRHGTEDAALDYIAEAAAVAVLHLHGDGRGRRRV